MDEQPQPPSRPTPAPVWEARPDPLSRKAEVDCSATAEKAIAEATAAATPAAALEVLYAAENTCRIGADFLSALKVMKEIAARIMVEPPQLSLEAVEALSRKRGQFPQVTSALFREWMARHLDAASEATLQHARRVTDGRLSIELEHSRITVRLSDVLAAAGRVKESAELLMGLQVETNIAMTRGEQADVVVLCAERALSVGETTLAHMALKKIVPSTLSGDALAPQRVRYYHAVVALQSAFSDHYGVACAFLAIAKAPGPAAPAAATAACFAAHAAFAAIAAPIPVPTGPARLGVEAPTAAAAAARRKERAAALAAALERPAVKAIPPLAALVRLLASPQAVRFDRDIAPLLPKLEAAGAAIERSPFVGAAAAATEAALRLRAAEHTLQGLAAWATRAPIARVAAMLGVTADEAESRVCEMVGSKQVTAAIDRLTGIVSFAPPPAQVDAIASWAESVNKVVALLDDASHEIQREHLVHSVRAAAPIDM